MKNKSGNRRFIIVLSAALLLLLGAVWLNIKLNREGSQERTAEPESGASTLETAAQIYGDYFNSFRKQRSEVRAQEIDYLRSILSSQSADADSVADAQARLSSLVSNMEKEFTIESLIRSKGFLDAAATLRDDSATVVIDGQALSDEEVARILDIIISETGLSAADVKISLGASGEAN